MFTHPRSNAATRQIEPGRVYNILSNTAKDITKREVLIVPGDSQFSPLPAGYGFDSGYGYGFVDAAPLPRRPAVPEMG
ncbi:MAG: hypothetical protein WDO56_05485 [Gammaproteobacteria bacterium]